jgi:hypothetical protein
MILNHLNKGEKMNEMEVKETEKEIEIELVDMQTDPKSKGKTQGCWGPSPDDSRNQC